MKFHDFYSPYSFHRMMIKWIFRWKVPLKFQNCIFYSNDLEEKEVDITLKLY